MAFFEGNGENYNEQIRKFETTDPAHADLFNAVVQELINNDTFIKNLTQSLKESLDFHLNTNNPHNIQELLNTYYTKMTEYSDASISNLINGAPSTLDTLGEIADAMEKNATVVEALDSAIGSKADEKTVKKDMNDIKGKIGEWQIVGRTVATLISGAAIDAGKTCNAYYRFPILNGATNFFPVLLDASYCTVAQVSVSDVDDPQAPSAHKQLNAMLINVSGESHNLLSHYYVLQCKQNTIL